MKKLLPLFLFSTLIFAQSTDSSEDPVVVSAQYDVEEVLVVTKASLILPRKNKGWIELFSSS